MNFEDYKEELYQKIKILYETIWGKRGNRVEIEKWIKNFDNEAEEINALFLLSQFMFFGTSQMREMLKVLFRDLFKYPIVENIRKNNNNTLDLEFINNEFNKELNKARFLGIGNNSESGSYLLYFFRQENFLSKDLFINQSEIFQTNIPKGISANDIIKDNKLFNDEIKHYIFIDDFCGSGLQAKKYSNKIVKAIKGLDSSQSIKVSYLVLFSTKAGREIIEKDCHFDSVSTVFELDDSFKCFSDKSRYYRGQLESIIDISLMESVCCKHGKEMMEIIGEKLKIKYPSVDVSNFANQNQLGFGNCQLLLGFEHNTPDNTLPIFWYNEGKKIWHPIFKRFDKVY